MATPAGDNPDTPTTETSSLEASSATATGFVKPAHVVEQLGQALGPTYTNLAPFTVGGMARLYSAHDSLLNRELIIKVLECVKDDPMVAAKRFSREAEIVANLNHPNIVPIYFAGRYDAGGAHQFFFAMKRIEGKSLDCFPAMEPSEVTRILKDLAWAVDHAHTAGIYHRDIKPSNICLESHTRRPILLDFGIAAIEGRPGLTKEGTLLGTYLYMSPEQLVAGKTADPRVDIYAVGEIGYRLLTGRDPFNEELWTYNLLAIKQGWTDHEFRRLSPDAPSRLVDAISKCMQGDAAMRYQTVAALARDLDSMMPTKVTFQALHEGLLSKQIDPDLWTKMAVDADFPPPLGDGVPVASLYILHNWLDEFGYTSIQELRARLDDLRVSAPEILHDFASSCEIDDPPYAIGVDVIRILLGIHHGATVDFPHLSIPEDRVSRQINRFLKLRGAIISPSRTGDDDRSTRGGA
jgi:serine/threonine protein kinase